MKWSGPNIANASGSIAGCTFARNRGGNYVRNRTIPINPQSIYQSTVRAAFGGLSQAWLTELTQTQRDGWTAYANAVSVPGFNGPIFLTGLNWFNAINTPRLQAGLDRIDTAPVSQTGTTLTPCTNPAIDVSDGEWDFEINGSDEWATVTGGYLFLYEGGPRNRTREFYKGPYRFLATIAGNTTTPPFGPVSQASNLVFAANQRCYLRVFAQALDGRMSLSQRMSAIATA